MSKDVEKNRKTLIRHFYSLPERCKDKSTTAIPNLAITHGWCLCPKGEIINKFMESRVEWIEWCDSRGRFYYRGTNIPNEIKQVLSMSGNQWIEMEHRYEGWSGTNGKESFSQIADWLQTLPNWPTVL